MKTDFSSNFIEQWEKVGLIMTALGSLTRQKIIMLFEPDEELNIKRIAEQFNLSRTAVVHHINVLQEANILKSKRVGKEVIMRVDWNLILSTLEQIKNYSQKHGYTKNI